jgi:hypothetical protein
MDGIRDLAAGADDVDNRASAARGHPLQHRVERMDVAEVLRVHRCMPRAGVEIRGRRAACRAGRIDEDIDRAESGFDLVDHSHCLPRLQRGRRRSRAARAERQETSPALRRGSRHCATR